ncbi:hypothetical protein [Micromonospora sp. CPCC 206061]|uniref:hypothetical protein n=1 Tax=Micromonospora sp. CPCC 206061 TaxID=3122410 RepID=UPI002FEFAA31
MASTREVLCLVNRPGNAVDRPLRRWAQQVDFVLGTDNLAALRTRAEALPETAWARLHRPAPRSARPRHLSRRPQDEQAEQSARPGPAE